MAAASRWVFTTTEANTHTLVVLGTVLYFSKMTETSRARYILQRTETQPVVIGNRDWKLYRGLPRHLALRMSFVQEEAKKPCLSTEENGTEQTDVGKRVSPQGLCGSFCFPGFSSSSSSSTHVPEL